MMAADSASESPIGVGIVVARGDGVFTPTLWSFFGSRTIHAATLVFDLGLTAATVFAIEHGRRIGSLR